ncbi:MAG: N-acetylmuramoyl-L-alanine amidase [Gemmatimonadetes bacterium]|nr:N-acetylmuramoyl-L-alanine amidase [Gemmatimonadota bacterium]
MSAFRRRAGGGARIAVRAAACAVVRVRPGAVSAAVALLLVSVSAVGSAQATAKPGVATRAAAAAPRQRLVVIDAGHGGTDPGTSGLTTDRRRIYEKHITLQVARRLAARLEGQGVKTLMTRDRDTLIALADRGRIANRANADVFISIHVNAPGSAWKNKGSARGFETYFLAEAKTEDERRVAAMENDAVRFEADLPTAAEDDALSFMLNDMAQNEHLRESSDLAATIQAGMRRTHPGPSRGVKQAGFRVLVTSFRPAVLVEIGFGSNVDEATYMASAAGQDQIAASIAVATVDYLARYERRVSGSVSGGSR